MVRLLLGFLAVAVLAAGCTSEKLNTTTTAPPDWGRWERFGTEVARLQSSWELDLALDASTDAWPQRLREVCATEQTPDAFGDLGERLVAADLEAGRDLGETESSEFFRESNLAGQTLWEFALDVCVPVPLTEAQEWVMPIWHNSTGLWESPEWPGRFEEVCALDPNNVSDYEPLAERYISEDVAAGMWLGDDDYPAPSGEQAAEMLWSMAIHPEPRDVCPQHALSNQQGAYDESASPFGTWHLTRYVSDGETAEPIGGSAVSLVVDGSGGFRGVLGCNNYILRFEDHGAGAIDVTTFWTTYKLCHDPEGIMAQEELLGSLLRRVVTFELTDEGLALTTDTGDQLMWSR